MTPAKVPAGIWNQELGSDMDDLNPIDGMEQRLEIVAKPT